MVLSVELMNNIVIDHKVIWKGKEYKAYGAVEAMLATQQGKSATNTDNHVYFAYVALLSPWWNFANGVKWEYDSVVPRSPPW